ncbi:MAG: hypothetical protein QXV22_01995, partial [Thermoplasmataceae archaeon]
DLEVESKKASDTEEAFRKHADIKAELSLIDRRIEALSDRNGQWEKLNSAVASFDLSGYEARRDSLRRRIEGIKSEIGAIEAETNLKIDASLGQKIKENDSIWSRINEYEKNGSVIKAKLEQIRSNLKSTEIEIHELEDSLRNLDILEAERSARVSERDKLKRQSEELNHEIIEKKSLSGASKQKIADLMEQSSSIKGKIKTREAMKKKRDTLIKIRQCLGRDGIQKIIRQEAAEYISRKVNDYISAFSLGVADVRVTEDMDIDVSMGDHVENIGMLSGGERTALSIALRLAIARFLAENVNTIIMDEPTNFLDTDRRSNLRDILVSAFGKDKITPQLVMVTHHHELASAASFAYSVVKIDGTSRVENYF